MMNVTTEYSKTEKGTLGRTIENFRNAKGTDKLFYVAAAGVAVAALFFMGLTTAALIGGTGLVATAAVTLMDGLGFTNTESETSKELSVDIKDGKGTVIDSVPIDDFTPAQEAAPATITIPEGSPYQGTYEVYSASHLPDSDGDTVYFFQLDNDTDNIYYVPEGIDYDTFKDLLAPNKNIFDQFFGPAIIANNAVVFDIDGLEALKWEYSPPTDATPPVYTVGGNQYNSLDDLVEGESLPGRQHEISEQTTTTTKEVLPSHTGLAVAGTSAAATGGAYLAATMTDEARNAQKSRDIVKSQLPPAYYRTM